MAVRPLSQFPFDRRNPDFAELFLYLSALDREQGTRLSVENPLVVDSPVQLPLSIAFPAGSSVFVEFAFGLGANTALAISTIASLGKFSCEVDGIAYTDLLTPIEVDRVTAGPTRGTIAFTAVSGGTLLFVADTVNPLLGAGWVNAKSYVRYY